MAEIFDYRIGSLRLRSDIPLGLPMAEPDDATRIPLTVEKCAEGRSAGDEERFQIDGRTYLLSAEGATIFYEPDGLIPDAAVAREVLDVVLPELLALTGKVVIHAAIVEREGKAILLTGSSGAGKSTLTLSLDRLGWRAGSDDFAILQDDLQVEYFGGPTRVWPDVRKAAGLITPNHSMRGKAIIERPWRARVRPIAAVVILFGPVEEHLDLFEIAGGDAFNHLIQSCFRKAVPGEMQLRRQIDLVSRLVDERPVLGLTVPRGLSRLDETARDVASALDGALS